MTWIINNNINNKLNIMASLLLSWKQMIIIQLESCFYKMSTLRLVTFSWCLNEQSIVDRGGHLSPIWLQTRINHRRRHADLRSEVLSNMLLFHINTYQHFRQILTGLSACTVASQWADSEVEKLWSLIYSNRRSDGALVASCSPQRETCLNVSA